MAARYAPGEPSKAEREAGITSSEGLDLNLPASAQDPERPALIHHSSQPAYSSPLRHQSRSDSGPRRPVKETLNAHSQYSSSKDDGTAEHRINQYLIKQEIGRGSFGAVHLASDQYGQEYAVKEFSKSRLRKRAQSNLLRRPTAGRKGNFTAGKGFNSPLHRQDSGPVIENNALDLIKEEIAIMKKLYHPNLVSLIEVLDDTEEDSLYMVMELCKNGIAMKVGLGEVSDPYPDEQCRHWFRDMILGIEYLHAQGIIHRDIKPDNCLVDEEGVLKLADFGVSEMFDKDSDMTTKKSAGSPAFMSPELCEVKHEAISGRAADIWSMGVTLFCLKFGKIPFEQTNILDLYEAIKEQPLEVPDCTDDLRQLLEGMLEKDPSKRLQMDAIRMNSWVTRDGNDPLLPRSQNIATIVEPPTQEELNHAITGNMGGLMVVLKAAGRFKALLARRQPNLIEGIFGRASRIVQPPTQMANQPPPRAQSVQLDARRPIEGALVREGIHREIRIGDGPNQMPQLLPVSSNKTQDIHGTAAGPHQPSTLEWTHQVRSSSGAEGLDSSPGPTPGIERAYTSDEGRGHAHDPREDSLYLNIGNASSNDPTAVDEDQGKLVSESPGAIDFNIYERAYQEEVERIMAAKQREPTIYLTRRVEGNKEIREDDRITDHSRDGDKPGLGGLIDKARANIDTIRAQNSAESGEKGEEDAGDGAKE